MLFLAFLLLQTFLAIVPEFMTMKALDFGEVFLLSL